MKNKYHYNGDILLEGNNLYEEVGVKLIILIPWFVFAQILEEIKHFISSILLNFIFFGGIKKILKEINKNGFIKINSYYSQNEINFFKEIINKEIKKKSKLNNFKFEGAVKFTNIGDLDLIGKVSRDVKLWLINMFTTFKFKSPTVKYLQTKFILNHQKVLASHMHFDTHKHEIKILVCLSDINKQNGATLFLKKSGSFKFKYFKQYLVAWLREKNIIVENKMNLIKTEDKDLDNYEYFTGNPGDIFIFNSRYLHRATEIKKGGREILWYYF